MRALMYHRLGEGRYAISKDLFEKHSEIFLKQPTVCVTFDDGHSSIMNAADILDDKSIKAYFFIITDCIDQKDFVTSKQIEDLSIRGHHIGSHGHQHCFMTKYNSQKLKEDLKTSIEVLQNIIQKPVDHLSFPGGRFNRAVLRIASESGFKVTWSSEPGFWCTKDMIERRGRDCILFGKDAKYLDNLLRGKYDAWRVLRYRGLQFFKCFCGDQLYHKLTSYE